jgi:hypothetical protein
MALAEEEELGRKEQKMGEPFKDLIVWQREV